MKHRFFGLSAAAALLASFSCSLTASAAYVIPGSLKAPDWVPQNFIEALQFTQKYGATHIEDNVICIVQRKQHYQQVGWEDSASFSYTYHPDSEKGSRTDNDPQWSENTYAFEAPKAPEKDSPEYEDYQELCMQIGWEPKLAVSGSIVDYSYTVLAYEIIPDIDLDVCLQTTRKKDGAENAEVIQERHYTFTSVYDAEIENIKITETDLYGWLPDCLSEYTAWKDKMGNFSAKNGYIVYADDVCIDGGYEASIQFSGTGMVEPVVETYIPDPRLIPPVGGTAHEICVYKPTRTGTVGIRVQQKRSFEPEDIAPVSDISGAFSIEESGEIKPIKQEEVRKLLPGDCDGNLSITADDVFILKRYLFGEESLNCWQNADMNGDGCVNAIDLSMLKRLLMSQNVPQPPFPDNPAQPNENLLYTVPIRFQVSEEFTLAKENPIRVYAVDEDGNRVDEPMSSTVDIPIVYSDGTPVYDGSGNMQWAKNQPRVLGTLENGFEIRLPRNIGKSTDGKNTVEIRIYAEKTIYPAPGGKDFTPYKEDVVISRIKLTYQPNEMENGKITKCNEELGKRFVIKENGDYATEDYTIPHKPEHLDTPAPMKLSLRSRYTQYGLGNTRVELEAMPLEQSKDYRVKRVTLFERANEGQRTEMKCVMDADIWDCAIDCSNETECSAEYYALAELVPFGTDGESAESVGVWSNAVSVLFTETPAP